MTCNDKTCMLDDEQHEFIDDEVLHMPDDLAAEMYALVSSKPLVGPVDFEPVPLRSAYMGTGTLPDDDDLAAFWDRMHVRIHKDYNLGKNCRPARRRTRIKWWLRSKFRRMSRWA